MGEVNAEKIQEDLAGLKPDLAVVESLTDVLNAILDSDGYRGTYDAAKNLDALKRADALLTKNRARSSGSKK